jgi:hypothetical protein
MKYLKGKKMDKAAKELMDVLQNYPIIKYFEYGHLPDHLKGISKPFAELAVRMARQSPSSKQETAAGLRKLLEAKDCAVRAALD